MKIRNLTAGDLHLAQAPQSVPNLKIKEKFKKYLTYLVSCVSLLIVSSRIEVSRAELGWLFGFVRLMVVSVVCSLLFFLMGRQQKIRKSLKITRSTHKSHSIKTHKKQDKSSISFLFKFPTDWGPCAFSGQNSVIIHGLTFRAFSDAVHFTSPNKTVKVSGFYEV